jgi:hypothetical protein
MNHVMLDLETFGTKPGAVIRSIGLVQFSPEGGPLGKTYYANISKDEQIAKGAHLDPNTVAWWERQSKKAEEALHGNIKSVETVLAEVFNFIKDNKLKLVWSQGSNFDSVLLDNLYERFGYKTPWLYYNTRDTRTIYDLAGFKCKDLPREGTAHNALDDAIHQAKVIQKCYEIIRTKGN